MSGSFGTLLSYARPHRAVLLSTLALTLLASACGLAQPLVAQDVLTALGTGDGVETFEVVGVGIGSYTNNEQLGVAVVLTPESIDRIGSTETFREAFVLVDDGYGGDPVLVEEAGDLLEPGSPLDAHGGGRHQVGDPAVPHGWPFRHIKTFACEHMI